MPWLVIVVKTATFAICFVAWVALGPTARTVLFAFLAAASLGVGMAAVFPLAIVIFIAPIVQFVASKPNFGADLLPDMGLSSS